MLTIGVDPGSRYIGYAVLNSHGNQFQLLDKGTWNLSKVENFFQKLDQLYSHCRDLVEVWKPDHIAFESLVFVKNPNSLIKLSQARGAMISAFAQTHHQSIFEYPPNLVKNAATGHGHASKGAIQTYLARVFPQVQFESEDESDAVAIALCHVLNYSHHKLNLTKVKSRGRGLSESLGHLVKGSMK